MRPRSGEQASIRIAASPGDAAYPPSPRTPGGHERDDIGSGEIAMESFAQQVHRSAWQHEHRPAPAGELAQRGVERAVTRVDDHQPHSGRVELTRQRQRIVRKSDASVNQDAVVGQARRHLFQCRGRIAAAGGVGEQPGAVESFHHRSNRCATRTVPAPPSWRSYVVVSRLSITNVVDGRIFHVRRASRASLAERVHGNLASRARCNAPNHGPPGSQQWRTQC